MAATSNTGSMKLGAAGTPNAGVRKAASDNSQVNSSQYGSVGSGPKEDPRLTKIFAEYKAETSPAGIKKSETAAAQVKADAIKKYYASKGSK